MGIVAEVEGDAPEPGGEAGAVFELVAVEVDAGEGFLGEVVAGVGVTGHAEAEAADGFLPALHEAGERGFVGLRLEAPHGLFVGERQHDSSRVIRWEWANGSELFLVDYWMIGQMGRIGRIGRMGDAERSCGERAVWA